MAMWRADPNYSGQGRKRDWLGNATSPGRNCIGKTDSSQRLNHCASQKEVSVERSLTC